MCAISGAEENKNLANLLLAFEEKGCEHYSGVCENRKVYYICTILDTVLDSKEYVEFDINYQNKILTISSPEDSLSEESFSDRMNERLADNYMYFYF